ncbi:cation:proton antiporter regulatory subunit [Chloroflexota bacterium]
MHSRGRELVLENIEVGSGSPLVGKTVEKGLSCCGALAILAVKKSGKLLPNPDGETLLELGDELVIIGTREQLRTVEGAV